MIRRMWGLSSLIGLVALMLFFTFGALTAPPGVVQAQVFDAPLPPLDCVIVNGDISGDTTWDQPCYHVVTSTVAIQPPATLTITPKVSVLFDPGARLSVFGRLHAVGQPAASITFTALQPPLHWQGLLIPINTKGTRIDHALFEYADTGVVIEDADYITITNNVFRYVGNSVTFNGAIGGDTDNSLIADNLIYSATHGIVLNESFNNQLVRNIIRDTTGYGVALIKQTTSGGDDNTIANNVISDTLHGLWLEKGNNNQVLSNSLTLNSAAGIYAFQQNNLQVQGNTVYGNGGDSAYRGGVVITGSSSLPDISRNVISDSSSSALVFDAGFVGGSATAQQNALCSAPSYELRNDSPILINAANTWWGTNTPITGVNWLGPVTAPDPIALAVNIAQPNLAAGASAFTMVTITLKDSAGHTVLRPNRSSAVNARLITLQTNLGGLSASTVEVDEQGVATATLTAGQIAGAGWITATAFCNYPITASFSVTPTNLAVSKQAPALGSEPGGLITYVITYSNTSAVTAPHVILTDTLPAIVNYVGDTSALPHTLSGRHIVWTAGEVPPYAQRTFSLTARVQPAASACGLSLSNALAIATPALETSYTDNVTQTTANLTALCADWAISKRADRAGGTAAEPIDFTIVFTNHGAAPVGGVSITDMLPTATQLISATPAATGPVGHEVTWALSEVLPVNTPYTIALRLAYTGSAPEAWLTNTAVITSPMFEVQPGNNVATAIYHIGPSLELTQWARATQIPAGPPAPCTPPLPAQWLITYTIGITNLGSTATSVNVTDTLPLPVTYVGEGWTPLGGRDYGWAIASLAGGANQWRTIVVTAALPAGGSLNLVNIVNAAAGSQLISNTHLLTLPLHRAFLPLIRGGTPIPVSFASSTYRVSESSPTAAIGLRLGRAACTPVSVTFSTADGTATAHADYTPTFVTAVFPPEQTALTVTVGIISDTLREADETVNLTLSSPQGAVLSAPAQAILTIADDDQCQVEAVTLASFYSPMDLAYVPGTDRLFIANRDGVAGGSVSVTHVSPLQHLANITGVLSAQGIVADAARQRLYVAGWDWLTVLDMNTYTTILTVPLGAEGMAHSVDYNPNNSKIYITNFNNAVPAPDRNTIVVVDAQTLTVTKRLTSTTIHPLREPSYVVVNPDTNKVYVTNHNRGWPNGWVTVIDSATDQIIKTIYLDPGGELYGLALDRPHNRVFVTGMGVANVYAIDGQTDLQTPPGLALKISRANGQTVPLRMIAVNPAVDPANPDLIRLWLTSSSTESGGLDQLISTTGEWQVVNGNQIAMTRPFLGIDVAPSPERGLRFDPVTQRVFVASAAANRVTIFPDDAHTQQCSTPLRPTDEELSITTVSTAGAPPLQSTWWWIR